MLFSEIMAAKKKTSKSAFILGLPLDMPAAEVVTRASEAGVSITNAYVYAIRSSQRRAARKSGGDIKGRPTRGLIHSRGLGAPKGENVESRFVALALDVGLARAEELLAKVRAKIPSFHL